MITKKQRAVMMRLTRRIALAEVADSWKGSQHPSDLPFIEHELYDARAALRRFLDTITEPSK